MRTTGFRSMVLYLLLAAFLGGLGYLLVNVVLHGGQWAMQPYNGHVYAGNSTVTLGDISDRDGNVLRRSIIWCDQRTGAECEEITRRVGKERLIEITANPALTGFTAGKILWGAPP